MLKAQYAILSEIHRQGNLGTHDFLGVFDRILVDRLPGRHRQMTLSLSFYAEGEDDLGKKQFVLKCIDPSGNPVFEQQGVFEMRPTAGTWLASHNLNFEFQGLPILQFGRYWFRFFVDGKEVAAHPFTVAKRPAHT